MSLVNLIWIEWAILALTLDSLLADITSGIRWIRNADAAPSYTWSAIGVAIVLHGLVTP